MKMFFLVHPHLRFNLSFISSCICKCMTSTTRKWSARRLHVRLRMSPPSETAAASKLERFIARSLSLALGMILECLRLKLSDSIKYILASPICTFVYTVCGLMAIHSLTNTPFTCWLLTKRMDFLAAFTQANIYNLRTSEI